MNDPMKWLQQWYWRHCDGDWEHGYGVTIETMDNPGWSLTINLEDTSLAQENFDAITIQRDEYDWLNCSVENSTFKGYCSPMNLMELIEIFASWVDSRHDLLDIFAAIEHLDIETLAKILEESPDQIERTDGIANGYTPLHMSVWNGDVRTVEFLLKKGADVNARSTRTGMRSPIFRAVNDVTMTSLLLRHGASVCVEDNQRRMPLHAAIEIGSGIDVVRLLLDAGADSNVIDDKGISPLYLTCEQGYTDIAGLLIEVGADIDQRDHEGISPVEIAINTRHVDIAEFLIKKGCEVFVKRGGFGLMHASASIGNVKLGRILIDKGVPLDDAGNSGRTPLHLAAQNGHLGFCRFLLKHGVRVSIEDKAGFTPLELATQGGHREIIELLGANDVNIH
ncbi:MAG: Imm53 family immunity protein [Armatimonadota bacterium]